MYLFDPELLAQLYFDYPMNVFRSFTIVIIIIIIIIIIIMFIIMFMILIVINVICF